MHLTDVFAGTALRWPQRPCLTWGGGHGASYREVADLVGRQQQVLQAAGLAGRRMGIMSANRPELVTLWLACIGADVELAFLNPQYTGPEVARIVDDLGLELLIGDRQLEDPGTRVVALPSEQAARIVELPQVARRSARRTDNAAAAIVLTSGSTGRPKYVPVPHAAYVLKGALNALALGWSHSDRAHCVMPLFHVGAQCETLAPAMSVGAAVNLAASFSASGLWAEIERHAITHLHGTASLLSMALARSRPRDGLALRRVVASLRGDVADALSESLPGVALVSLYGLTECPLGTLSGLGDGYRQDWVGYPYGGWRGLRLVDGEIQLRNAACATAYLGPDGGSAVTADGWLRTGDRGRADDGGLYLVGRIKDMIRRSGENIAPAEIEEAALRHPAIIEAAALGHHDATRDEEVRLFVQCAAGAEVPTPDELRSFMGGWIARFKLPRYIDVVADMPKTPSNKVDKPTLAQRRPIPEWDADRSVG